MQVFPTTSWTLVGNTGATDPAALRQALSELLKRYLPALRAHLIVRKRIRPESADDLLQGFIAGHILERELLNRADRTRGKFRTFLLTALDRYMAKQSRHERAAKRSPGPGGHAALAEDSSLEPQRSDVFDAAWARQVIAEALRRMQESCESSGRPELWALFQGRVVAPAYDGVEPLAYEPMMRQFGFTTVSQAANALVTAKRIFSRMLFAVVTEYARNADEVEQELRDLKSILAGPRA